ncbi:MAG TPA: GtrA family protein [Burkholderiales bacterium]|jgi:putative flippase GtrA
MAIGRFLGVGLACALLHNVIMIGGDFAGWHYFVSSLVSLAVVTVFGYVLHTRWTFPGAARGHASFARYAATVSANYPLSLAGLYVFVDLLGVPVPLAAPAVTALLFLFNWIANRWALRVKRGQA